MLFVHGYPFDRSMWRHQLAALDGLSRIAPDLRGMGDSDAPDLGYSMETYADDLAALLDTLGDRRVGPLRAFDGWVCGLRVPAPLRRRVGLVLVDTRAEADSPEGREGPGLLGRDSPGAAAPRRSPKPCSRGAGRPDPRTVGATVEQVQAMMAATPGARHRRRTGRHAGPAGQLPLLADLVVFPTWLSWAKRTR